MNENFAKFINEVKAKSMEGKELYESYYLIKNATRVLKELNDEYNQLIVEEMQTLGVEKQEFDFGKFTRAKKISWEYEIPEIYQMEKSIKELQLKAQEEGTATKKETEYLIFK